MAFIIGPLLLGFARDHAGAQSPRAEILVGTNAANPGNTNVGIAVTLESFDNAQVSILGFDLKFDNSKLAYGGIVTGTAALAAGKTASVNQIAGDTIRILVAGLNDNTIGNGTVATILFDVDSGALGGVTQLEASVSSVGDPAGQPVTHAVIDGSISINSPTSTPSPTSTNTPVPTNTQHTGADQYVN